MDPVDWKDALKRGKKKTFFYKPEYGGSFGWVLFSLRINILLTRNAFSLSNYLNSTSLCSFPPSLSLDSAIKSAIGRNYPHPFNKPIPHLLHP